MRIKKMTATFGRLEGETLTLTPGLNILEAPNEGGKSTWCAFLRAMLYGIPTKERDRVGYLAEKNRYQPWSGAPMEGSVDITWNNQEITFRRFSKGNVPFGGFEAVNTVTGEPIAGLTAENAGETLVGVPREVFERSAFVGQSGVAVDGSPELEKRIAALVSSGEEDVSFSETERTLKDWLNRRKHNKSGLIPKLEAELEELDATLSRLDRVGRALAEAQGEKDELERRKTTLEAEQNIQKARAEKARREEYGKAVAYLSQCRSELSALTAESGPLPDKESLRAAQGELVYYNTLGANQRLAENEIAETAAAAREARAAAYDPLFPGLTADRARDKAAADREKAGRMPKMTWLWLVFALGWAVLGGCNLLFGNLGRVFSSGMVILAMGGIVRFIWSRKKRAECAAILVGYEADTPEEITRRAEDYGAACAAADEAERKARDAEASADRLSAERAELSRRLFSFVKPFAPEVTDAFGISAALSKALSLDERMATARVKLEGAQKLVSSIPAPSTEPLPDVPETPSAHSPAETAAMLAAVQGELTRVNAALGMAQGERTAVGDSVELEARRGAAGEALRERQSQYDAISLALEVLGEANADLQSRFSPALNQRTGQIFAALTGGKYEEVTLTRGFEASAREVGAVLPRRALALSRGTADQLYLAVRLAVCAMALPEDEGVPLILDDALANFDGARMALALDYLKKESEKRQILLFTCHTREKDYLA